MMYMCYHCGFEAEGTATFASLTTSDRHGWLTLICPQCSVNPAKVGLTPAESRDPLAGGAAPWPQPKWKLEGTDQGLYVTIETSSCTLSVPLHAKHPLRGRSAPDWTGCPTFGAYDAKLKLEGEVKHKEFHRQTAQLHEVLREQELKLGFLSVGAAFAREQCHEEVNKLREVLKVGPHAPKIEIPVNL